jgi:hypothetical protein
VAESLNLKKTLPVNLPTARNKIYPMKTQKSFSARIICSKEQLKQLWQLHLAYHRRLRSFLSLLQSALNGTAGNGNSERAEFYKNFVEFILASDAKNAKYLNIILNRTDGQRPGSEIDLPSGR